MSSPYIIDNRAHILSDVLKELPHVDAVHALDVPTACFNVRGFDFVREGVQGVERGAFSRMG